MDHLRKELAPISSAAWDEIEDEANRTLRHYLAGRHVVGFDGPHGWSMSAVANGRTTTIASSPDGVEGKLRTVQPLVELRQTFELSRAELDAVDRGSSSPDLDPLIDAAQKFALTEDRAIFHGYAAAGITGIAEASPHEPVEIRDDYNLYPGSVARATAKLRAAGIAGPYAIALGPRCYTGVVETTEHGGYPVLEHIRMILGGPVVWAPGVNGAVVVSLRGGDYELVVGQDVSIGYLNHTDETV